VQGLPEEMVSGVSCHAGTIPVCCRWCCAGAWGMFKKLNSQKQLAWSAWGVSPVPCCHLSQTLQIWTQSSFGQAQFPWPVTDLCRCNETRTSLKHGHAIRLAAMRREEGHSTWHSPVWDRGRKYAMCWDGKTGHFQLPEEAVMNLFSKPRMFFPAYLLRLLMLAHYFRTFYKVLPQAKIYSYYLAVNLLWFSKHCHLSSTFWSCLPRIGFGWWS